MFCLRTFLKYSLHCQNKILVNQLQKKLVNNNLRLFFVKFSPESSPVKSKISKKRRISSSSEEESVPAAKKKDSTNIKKYD